MSRMPRAGGRYITPILTSGAEVSGTSARGMFLLEAATRYLFILGGADAPFISAHLTGYDAALIITSATIEDCNHPEQEVTNQSTVAGEWIGEDPTTAFVGTEGAGWTATNGVLAVAGGALGGAFWHIAETAAYRTRLNVLVGAAGGLVRLSSHGKD